MHAAIPSGSSPSFQTEVSGVAMLPSKSRRATGFGRVIAVFLFVLLGFALSATVGQAQNTSAYQSVRTFLDQKDSATTVLFFVHFGTTYRSHQFLRETRVADDNGNVISGQSAVVYRYHWEDDGVTDVAFFYDSRGNIFGSSVDSTNAQFNQPFAFANLSIRVVGRFVINSDDKMSAQDRRLALDLVDRSDAHGLMNLWLRMR